MRLFKFLAKGAKQKRWELWVFLCDFINHEILNDVREWLF